MLNSRNKVHNKTQPGEHNELQHKKKADGCYSKKLAEMPKSYFVYVFSTKTPI